MDVDGKVILIHDSGFIPECRRHSPVMPVDRAMDGCWPTTSEDGWCGEYEPESPPKDDLARHYHFPCPYSHPEPEKIITFTDPAHKFGDDITLGVVSGDSFIMSDKARRLLEAWHKEEHSKQNQAGSLEQRVETLRSMVEESNIRAKDRDSTTYWNALRYALAIMEGA
jgi:hypothetical protein